MDRFLLFFLVCCASIASAEQSMDEALVADRALWASITSSQIVVPKAVPKEWHIIEDPDFHLSLGFPCVPEHEVLRGDGNDIVVYKCVDSEGIAYAALYGSRSNRSQDEFNADEIHAATAVGFMNGAKRAGLDMTAIPQMRLSYLDLNGRQIKFESGRSETEVRMLVRRNFSCQMSVGGPLGQLGKTAPIFFDSLNISHQGEMEEVNQDRDNPTKVTNMALSILFLNIIAYFGCSFLAKAVNYVAKREVLPRRLIGSIGVLLVTGFLLVLTLQALSTSEEKLKNISLRERAVMEGEIVGQATFPGAVVLIAVGITAWRKRRKTELSPNKLSGPTS